MNLLEQMSLFKRLPRLSLVTYVISNSEQRTNVHVPFRSHPTTSFSLFDHWLYVGYLSAIQLLQDRMIGKNKNREFCLCAHLYSFVSCSTFIFEKNNAFCSVSFNFKLVLFVPVVSWNLELSLVHILLDAQS